MSQVLRRAVVAAAAGSMLLTGCSTSVDGTASAARPVTDVAADQFPITGVSDDEVDTYARNALADLVTFWEEAYPEAYGEPFQPLSGGFYAVDSENIDYSLYPEYGVGCPALPVDPEEAAGGAFYNRLCDNIVYDSALLTALGRDAGPFIGPAVMAHEMGHAMQNRFGYSEDSIRDETQADCFAGAFTRWVAEGNARHVTLRVAELDRVVIGFLGLRDPVGSDPDNDQAHGSGFDRVSGFLEGYDGGVLACRDEFGPERVFTELEFTTPQDEANRGNASYARIGAIIDASLTQFYDSWFPQVSGGTPFEHPTVQTFDGTAPDCGQMGAEDRDLGYCEADSTVYVDEAELLQPAYQRIGDFAVATAVSLPYAQAARQQLGRSFEDSSASVSSVCLTGWYTARFFSGDFAQDPETAITLSPGDVDEAVIFLLTYGQQESVFPGVEAHGFELVGAFRDGFIEGGAPCDLGF